MPSIWVSDEDYEALIDIKADLERYRKKPASFSDVVSHLMVKKRMLGGKSRKEVKNTRRDIRAKALTAAISALMLISMISVFQTGVVSAQETSDYQSAIIKAADNLLATQNEDGGWEWENADNDPSIADTPTSFRISTRGLTGSHVK